MFLFAVYSCKSHQSASYHAIFLYSEHQFRSCSFELSLLRLTVTLLVDGFQFVKTLFLGKVFDSMDANDVGRALIAQKLFRFC